MRVVLQVVTHASCTIDQKIVGSCQKGYMALVGFCESDTEEIVDKMIQKIIKLRVFVDENEMMNLSIQDIK